MKFLSAFICVYLWFLPGISAQVRMDAGPALIRIEGPGWTLRYGTSQPWFRSTPQWLELSSDRALVSHGSRLRLIDTRQGRVIGRWLYPTEISSLTRQGEVVQVQISEHLFGRRDNVVQHTFVFDPQHPVVPYWPSPSLFWGSPSACEPKFQLSSGSGGCPTDLPRRSGENPAEDLPLVEDMARRDPFSPWFALTMGDLLRAMNDPRAGEWFDRAARTQGSDFIDLLSVATQLERRGEEQAATTAFEAGFQDFLARGHDPHLFLSLEARGVLFPSNWQKLAGPARRAHLERLYRLAPATEGASLAWNEYARMADRSGQVAESELWRGRAAEARATSLFVMEPAASQRVDLPLRIGLGAVLGALLLLLSCSGKYFVQRGRGTEPGEFRFFLTEFWTWPERAAFLFLALSAWLALGVAGGYYRGVLRLDSLPFGARFGSFAGPLTAAYFENELSPSPEQQMLASLSRQPGPRPAPEQMERALGLRVSTSQAVLWAVGGPLVAGSFLKSGLRFWYVPLAPVQAAVIVTCLLLPLAMFIFLVPRQEAFPWGWQPRLWETLVPASAWGWLGGIVLLVFSICLIQDAIVYARGAPCFVAWTCNPFLADHLQSRFGLPQAVVFPDGRPNAIWLYVVPLGIWVVNVICVFLRPSRAVRLAAGAPLRP